MCKKEGLYSMLPRKEKINVLLRSAGISIIIAVLFYRSFWGLVFFPVVFGVQLRWTWRDREERRKEELRKEFLYGMGVLNSSVQAGLSIENAWKEVEKETRLLHGNTSEFYQELKEINQRAAHNVPIEKLFLAFAYRCEIEEIIQFAELLEFGKRSGSNWKNIIDITVDQMMEQQAVKMDIEVMVAEKKMEQKIMNLMPLGILAFLQISAGDYMSVLYHNWFGILIMTLFLFGYFVAILLSQKILKVQI